MDSSQANQIVNQIAISIANWSTAMAVANVKWLLAAIGQSTEPDLSQIAPVYDRMLAIALLLAGAVIAIALIERIGWGSLGLGLAVVPRVVAGTFFAFAGLGAVKYVAGYSALLATTWSPDFMKLTETLIRSVAASDVATQYGAPGAHVSVFGLIVTATCLSCLTVLVHLELVVRSALILSITSFVPLVSVMWIWPRLTRVATTMAEFVVGLLLSKFVVATVVYVGFRLVVNALASPVDNDTTENWMASGVAVLLIAAFSPVVIFTGLRFAHGQAASVTRGLAGGAGSLLPTAAVTALLGRFAKPLMRPLLQATRGRINQVARTLRRP